MPSIAFHNARFSVWVNDFETSALLLFYICGNKKQTTIKQSSPIEETKIEMPPNLGWNNCMNTSEN